MKKIMVIGAGGIARSVHFPSLRDIIKESGNIEITAVCDLIEERAKSGAAYFGDKTKWGLSYLNMIDEHKPHAVFLLTQPDQSYRMSVECIKRGIDVFCEKPAGATLFQLKSLERMIRDSNVIYQVGFNRRYIPLVKEIYRIMKDTTPITQVSGCFYKNGTSAFFNGAAGALESDVIHVMDLLCMFAGAAASSARTVAANINSEIDNAWNSVLRFENGTMGVIKSNYQTGGRVHLFEIHGPKASAYINLGFGTASCDAKIIFFGGKESYSLASTGTLYDNIGHFDGMDISGSKEMYRFYGYYDEDREFIDCIHTRKTPGANIYEAINAMGMSDLIRNGVFN